MGVVIVDKFFVDRFILVYVFENVFIYFEVCDIGIGINLDKLKDMFKFFI